MSVCRILPDPVKEQLLTTIKKTFSYSEEQAERVYYELIMCMKKKHLVSPLPAQPSLLASYPYRVC